MSTSQETVLQALCRQPMTVVGLATIVDGRVPSVQRTLDALSRKSLVMITPAGTYALTGRGQKKVSV